MENILISPNFYLSDLTISDYAVRNNLLNLPLTEDIECLKVLAANVIEILNAKIGPIHINSAYRSPSVNSAIGGAQNSQHCKGQAADITKPGWSAVALYAAIQSISPDWDQLILEFDAWVHCSFVKIGNRREKWRADKINGKTIYTKIV